MVSAVDSRLDILSKARAGWTRYLQGQAVVNDQMRVRNWIHLPPLVAWT
jgi:hypothetical protein